MLLGCQMFRETLLQNYKKYKIKQKYKTKQNQNKNSDANSSSLFLFVRGLGCFNIISHCSFS